MNPVSLSNEIPTVSQLNIAEPQTVEEEQVIDPVS